MGTRGRDRQGSGSVRAAGHFTCGAWLLRRRTLWTPKAAIALRLGGGILSTDKSCRTGLRNRRPCGAILAAAALLFRAGVHAEPPLRAAAFACAAHAAISSLRLAHKPHLRRGAYVAKRAVRLLCRPFGAIRALGASHSQARIRAVEPTWTAALGRRPLRAVPTVADARLQHVWLRAKMPGRAYALGLRRGRAVATNPCRTLGARLVASGTL